MEVIKYSQMLGRLMAERVGIAVAGTHGKSTTPAMVAYALTAAGLDPSFVVGATVEQLGGPSGVGLGRHFVAEACEFDRSFLNLCPPTRPSSTSRRTTWTATRTSRRSSRPSGRSPRGCAPAGVLVANGEDRNVGEAVRAAALRGADLRPGGGLHVAGADLTTDRGRCRFDVLAGGQAFCRVALQLPGLHNVYNALAAAALLHHAGLSG